MKPAQLLHLTPCLWLLLWTLFLVASPAWSAFFVEDYLPLPIGATWTYTGNYSTSVNGESTINGALTNNPQIVKVTVGIFQTTQMAFGCIY